MIDTIFFDNWNTLVQAPNLMRADSSTEFYHSRLQSLGYDVMYQDVVDSYRSISRVQRQKADEDNYRELDYIERLTKVLIELGIPDQKDRATQLWKAYLEEWITQSEFFPETPGILKELHGKYKLGIITNFMDGPTGVEVFKKLGYYEIFDTLINSAEIGYRKPAKIIFEKALEETGSQPKSAIMVGDTFGADIVGANKMGIRNILIDLYDNQQENYDKATVVIRNLSEFMPAFRKLETS
jgi:putative hydrolase of the HAD superfamily